MSNTKRTITVTVPARHETTRWTDETFIEFGQYEERRPMTRTTTVETGPVLVEIDVAQIAAEIAASAMYNAGKKAGWLRGSIRAKVLEVEKTETTEPSIWTGPIEVWTKPNASRWNLGETITKFVALGDDYSLSRSEMEEAGWTYEETINDTEGGTT